MTKDEQIKLILQLINKDDTVKAQTLSNKRKTKKEIEIEVCENAIKHRISRAIKKNLSK